MPLELVDDCRLALGEGVVWDHKAQLLYWIGIEDRQVRVLGPGGGAPLVLPLDTRPGTLAPYRDGRVLLAVEQGFVLLDTATGALETVAPVEADQPGRRMNDGKCDPYGRMVAGTMTLDEPRVGGPLYRLEYRPDGTAEAVVLREGMLIPNGLDWPEPDRLWHIDSGSRSIRLFDYPEHGPLADPVRTLDISELSGDPDGMTLDAEGNLWVAFWGGSAVRCLSPEGKLLETVELPTGKVSSCAFGGPDLNDLYITTAGGGPGADPGAGSLYRVPGLTTGRPARYWAGPAGSV
ncbi:SMP-30/gluconolactonase/LRE family protein [Streptacidiphilus sp. N1-12]|uniref:SMP-30/gluconolactonase/LRE family protein n=2 Tax=Streptacidiphilus alkalitolerans TaxID=3342712 RepID=A0ABV6VLD5_9ACTN